jgi:hypothetical protein
MTGQPDGLWIWDKGVWSRSRFGTVPDPFPLPSWGEGGGAKGSGTVPASERFQTPSRTYLGPSMPPLAADTKP